MIGKSYAKIAIVGFVLCLAMVLCASFARYRSEQSFIDGAENGFGIDGMYVNDGATRPSMAILAGEDMEWQICNDDGSCMSGRLAATSDPNSLDRIAVQFTCRMHHEMGWTAFSTSPTSLAISRCAGLTECRLLLRSESSRRPADQAAGVSNPEFIRTHTDECGKCPDEVDNQGNKAVLPGTALAWTLTTTSQSTLISSRNAHGQISDAGAWRTFEIYWTSKTTTHTACSPTAKTRWLSTMRSETA